MDAGALELHLRRLAGVVACQLTATEAVLLLDGGDPAAVRIAAQAALDQAGSNRTIHLLAVSPAAPPAPVWRRRRFAVLAGAAGALSAGIAAASTLASMPGVVQPADEVAVAAPEEAAPADRWAVRTQVPAPARAETAPAPDEVTEVPEPATDGVALVSTGTDGAATPGRIALAPVAAPQPLDVAPAAPVARPEPQPAPAPAPAPTPEPGVSAAGADDGDDRPGRGRGRESHPDHPHGTPPGHLMRAGHGPW